MSQLGNVHEIILVKKQLDLLKQEGLLASWELPYENILTRLSAAIFFLTPVNEAAEEKVWNKLSQIDGFKVSQNTERTLSQLKWRIEFN